MKKIALLKIGALGDVLMTTPLVRQLRRALPQTSIDYLVGQASGAILEGNPHISRLVRFDESILYRRKIARLGSLVRLLRGYDAILVLDKHWIFALLARLAGVPVRIGFARRPLDAMFLTRTVPYGPVKHEIAYYLALGEALGLPIDGADVAMELPPSDPCPMEQPYTVLVNGGGANANEQSTVRRMPESLFSDLVSACRARGKVVFLGGKDEARYYDRFAGERTVNLCGRTSLREAWDLLRHAQSVFSTDTGLMHMAGALNPNLTAIFGPTHPGRKCPPGAGWVWTDQDLYDDRYELYGEVPERQFFRKMSIENIMRPTKA
ncbi:glycosyltransferase family 9 protein [Caenimonas terrae]|uniref:Glycosyltransferase family 9 protein n=1 Tax=Caenimonas terrae TaxID=696074 RepID=A0ABW0N7R5_9BURK